MSTRVNRAVFKLSVSPRGRVSFGELGGRTRVITVQVPRQSTKEEPKKSVLEIINDAAQAEKLVQIDYVKVNGQMVSRTVEPYSIRLRKKGEALMLVDRDGHTKNFYVAGITNASRLNRSFTPKFPVEKIS